MNDSIHVPDEFPPYSSYQRLAQWLQHALTPAPEKIPQASTGDEKDKTELPIENDYHPLYYKQLPDFIVSLLQRNPRAIVQYAPLLFHMAGCPACHRAYLDLYHPILAAVQAGEAHSSIARSTRTLNDISPRLLVHLCHVLISQAEAILVQAQREGENNDPHARSLLQLAIQIGTQISSDAMRSSALRDLVRVATFSSASPATQEGLSFHAETAGGSAHRGLVKRRGEPVAPQPVSEPGPAAPIRLQSGAFAGSVTQQEDLLELHLHGLDQALRGHYLEIAIPLGALIEPVRWSGGDPHTIRSTAPVDEQGNLVTPLGRTSLHLQNQEERNLLEIIFLRLEIRAMD